MGNQACSFEVRLLTLSRSLWPARTAAETSIGLLVKWFVEFPLKVLTVVNAGWFPPPVCLCLSPAPIAPAKAGLFCPG